MWWNFTWAVKSLKFCTVVDSFCKNQAKFQPKKVLKTHLPWHWKLMQSLKKNWLVVSNIYDMRNLVNFHPTTQKSKNFTPMGYFCPKYMRFELKKYRGVIFHDTEQWWKIWKTLTLWFQKWHEELGDLSSLENPKVWKLYIDGLFLSKVYTVSARNFHKNYLSWTEGCCKV